MSIWRRTGLTTRIAIALAAVAVASVGISTVLANLGLHNRVDQASEARTTAATTHAAEVAAALYAREGKWTPQTRAELEHAASIGGYSLTLIESSAGSTKPSASTSAVRVDGQRVGTVVLEPEANGFVMREDQSLASRLDRLHLLAAALALLLGVLSAPLIASALTRPLRRIAAAATRLRNGELDVRVDEGGPHEIAAVGQALDELASTLEQEELLRREAAADVAHELRTPLAGVISRIEAAQDHVIDDEQANLDAMRAEAQRLAELMEDLERFSDAQRPGLTLNKMQVDVCELARERLAIRRADLDRQGLAVIEEIAPPAIVLADRSRLTQVIDNLLTNASRYTDSGEVRVNVHQAGGKVFIAVSDTGIGLSEDEAAHVFERFWRADPSRSRGTGGTGVGLAIARELTRAHAGTIDVESEVGVGSTFTVSLPASTPSQ
ncbi:MAG: HAMP domain-containing histidine kinase [Thermoleophilaceae bacterium]|nr:HAMP domain-containing histidine kinase [Thermoleophilaceae bacterium]